MSVNITTIRYREPANNALNQATRFTQGSKRIECVYDYRNRRVEKAVYEGGTLSTRTRFIYRGYLQIAELDASTATESLPAILRKTYLWDPNEPTATRILALTTYDTTGNYEAELYYTHDAQKNTTALFGIQAGRRASYQYSAYGSLLHMDGELAALNPFRFSSEYHDEDLDLIYYNYRYYNPTDGRWIHRDPIEEQGGVNLYGFVRNNPSVMIDALGSNPQDNTKIPLKVGDPIDQLPHAGQYAGEGGGNCASESMDEEEPFDPTLKPGERLPKEFSDRGCRRVVSAQDCRREIPREKHVVFSMDVTKKPVPSDNKPGRWLPYSYHVIGEDCANPGTYKTKLGKNGVRVNNIKDPQKSAQEYFGVLNKKAVIMAIEMCCPCKK